MKAKMMANTIATEEKVKPVHIKHIMESSLGPVFGIKGGATSVYFKQNIHSKR
jgi:formyltetrahydrofolate synthetase